MRRNVRKALWVVLLAPFVLAGLWLHQLYRSIEQDMGGLQAEPLRIAVTDPLCNRLAADYLKGQAQRDYAPLGVFLEEKLRRPVEIGYGPTLRDIRQSSDRAIDLVIGKASAVSLEAAETAEPIRPIARLTDAQDDPEVRGLFVVRTRSPAKAIGDLEDHRILFGPPREVERHAEALALLAQNGVTPVPPLRIVPDCAEAIAAVVKSEADVAIVPDYLRPLLEDLAGVEKGALRVVGQTTGQPFITVFATARISPSAERAILDALLSVRDNPPLLTALASRSGFVPLTQTPQAQPSSLPPTSSSEWTDWRGPGRSGISPDVPAELPATPRLLWKRRLTGGGLSGVSATAKHVIVADKSEQNDQDIWRCLDAETGREVWTVAYPTPREMEFTNVPRAAPVIHGGFAYLLGAFGDLHCVSVEGSRIVWRRNLIKEFNAKLPTWGMCSSPLLVDDMLVVNPGAPDASLVALGLYTGETLWQTPGEPAGYGSLILGAFGGVRQIVGHDATSLAGWDPNTGKRLWTLLPARKGDFNVPTPLDIDGRLLVATENNGARLYDFDANGRIHPIPIAQNRRLTPDTSTPVAIDGLLFGCFRGFHCLNLHDSLNTLYTSDGSGAFNDYAALIAGNGHVLAITVKGELILLKAAREAFTPLARLRLFEDTEVWSHPALIGNRLYIRSMKEICCFLLDNS
jgi:outer membrane protein assembly factor BamB/ABC-type phosphate/phosphonate transport system substrate-binding protein